MAIKQRVLVTGAAGQIGGIIRNKLGYRYELTGLDVVDHDYPTSHVADLSDLDAITPAFERQEVIVHLGADPSPSGSWDSILQNNIIGTRNVYEAARLAGVQRVILASTNHVVGYYPMKQNPYKAIYDGRLSEVRRPLRLLDHTDIRPEATTASAKRSANRLAVIFTTLTDCQ